MVVGPMSRIYKSSTRKLSGLIIVSKTYTSYLREQEVGKIVNQILNNSLHPNKNILL